MTSERAKEDDYADIPDDPSSCVAAAPPEAGRSSAEVNTRPLSKQSARRMERSLLASCTKAPERLQNASALLCSAQQKHIQLIIMFFCQVC